MLIILAIIYTISLLMAIPGILILIWEDKIVFNSNNLFLFSLFLLFLFFITLFPIINTFTAIYCYFKVK